MSHVSDLFGRYSVWAARLTLVGTLILGQNSVYAQKATGDIYGKAQASTTVKIENLDTGNVLEETVKDDGTYKIERLPVGRYKVTTTNGTKEVQVSVGRGVEVDMTSKVETLEVTGTKSAVNAIDISSVESSTVFSATQIEKMPVGRDITSVSLLAPGTVLGDQGFSKSLPSFGGSSVAENGYFVNGFDVTNLRTMMSFASLPFEAISEQQIKTGGYGAEFGRSMGGIINIVTKRGTNTWKGGVSTYWNPEKGRADLPNVASKDPSITGVDYAYFKKHNKYSDLQYNAYLGGPLLENKIFFFGILNGQRYESNEFKRNTSRNTKIETPKWLAKLDANITDNHLLEYTGIGQKENSQIKNYTHKSTQYYSPTHTTQDPYYELQNGGLTHITKYTGYLTDDLTVSAMYGHLDNLNNWRDRAPAGAECPIVIDARTVFTTVARAGTCFKSNYIENRLKPNKDTRDAVRLDVDYTLWDHSLRLGYDHQKFMSTQNARQYSGNAYYRYANAPASGKILGAAHTGQYVRKMVFGNTGGTYDIINTAAYFEDNWQTLDDLKLYLGVRMETFDNKNASKVSFAKSENLFAPRLGGSYDVFGDSTFKVFTTLGRYYIPIPAQTNIRMVGGESTVTSYHSFTGIAADGTPTGTSKIAITSGGANANNDVTIGGYNAVEPNPATVVSKTLKPMHQDELILGAQKQMFTDWVIGGRGIYRKVRDGMDDTCYHKPFTDWATAQGLDPDAMNIPICYFMNPGKDQEFDVDIDGAGTIRRAKMAASLWGMPEYKREYLALDIFWERVFDGTWYFQGSYTLAKSYGNAEGYVISTIKQEDGSITQDWDYPSFTHGADGELPNSRRHTLKMFGSYRLDDNWEFSGNGLLQSGRPRNCLGYVPSDADGGEAAGYTTASSFYCVKNGVTTLGKRGDQGTSPWVYNLDLGIAYNLKVFQSDLRFKLDIFNIFNLKNKIALNDTGDVNSAVPVRNPDFGAPENYQSPRTVRVSARYDF